MIRTTSYRSNRINGSLMMLCRTFSLAIFLLCTGCSTLSSTALQHTTFWTVTPAPNANGDCTLTSTPHAYTTLAGGDKLVITIKNNKIVSIGADFESLASVNRQATGISIDNQPPITNPLISENIHELVFDEQKSSQLIDAFKKGTFAHIKLALPTQNRPVSIHFSLEHFSKALLELRMCNMFNTENKK